MLETVNNSIKEYMKSGDKTLLSIARSLKSELMVNEKNAQQKTEIEVVKSCKKKLLEEIEAFKSVSEKVAELNTQLEWLEQFMPKMVTESELEDFWKGYKYDVETGELIKYNMGQIMGILKKEYGERLDGKVASAFAQKYIKETFNA